MPEELFDQISALMGKSGAGVSKKIDGTITVTLPDSDADLATCTDNGDDNVTYTLFLGDGSTEEGTGTVEDFAEHASSAIDTWLEFAPYDADAIEPGISQEYRTAIGESIDTKMRSSLYGLGLNRTQVEAVVEIANILFESAKEVTVTIKNRTISAPTVKQLVSANRRFLARQLCLEKLGMKVDDRRPLDELAKEANVDIKDDDALSKFLEPYMDSMQENRYQSYTEKYNEERDAFAGVRSDKDLEKEDKRRKEAEAKGEKVKPKFDETSIAGSDDDIAAPESGEAEDYDEELGHADKKTEADLKKADKEDAKSDDASDDDEPTLMKEDTVGDELGSDVDVQEGENELSEDTIDTMWSGDIDSLAEPEELNFDYDVPVKVIKDVETQLNEINKQMLSYRDAFKTVPDPGIKRVGVELFGNGENTDPLGGIIGNILSGDRNTIRTLESNVDSFGDASKKELFKTLFNAGLTKAQEKEFKSALKSEVCADALNVIAQRFEDICSFLLKAIPDAYDEARGIEPYDSENGSADGHLSNVDPKFVKFLRQNLSSEGVGIAECPWSVLEVLCSDDIGKLFGNGEEEKKKKKTPDNIKKAIDAAKENSAETVESNPAESEA